MTRKMTEEEIEALYARQIEVGAIGRNAFACRCGHIDYRPNTTVFRNCWFEVTSCIECRDESVDASA